VDNEKSRKQIVFGCILFGTLIVTGSIQIIFTPFSYVKSVMLLAVIACSMGLGAFIRELYILKERKGMEKIKVEVENESRI
jgi:uncharacterized membrane protein YcjF (UPF0283 family)